MKNTVKIPDQVRNDSLFFELFELFTLFHSTCCIGGVPFFISSTHAAGFDKSE